MGTSPSLKVGSLASFAAGVGIRAIAVGAGLLVGDVRVGALVGIDAVGIDAVDAAADSGVVLGLQAVATKTAMSSPGQRRRFGFMSPHSHL